MLENMVYNMKVLLFIKDANETTRLWLFFWSYLKRQTSTWSLASCRCRSGSIHSQFLGITMDSVSERWLWRGLILIRQAPERFSCQWRTRTIFWIIGGWCCAAGDGWSCCATNYRFKKKIAIVKMPL